MERKLVQYTTIFICAFSLFVCVAVWFLPIIERSAEAFVADIIEERRAREERYALLEKMSGLEIMDYNTQQVQEQARKEQEKKIQEKKAQEKKKQDEGDAAVKEEQREAEREVEEVVKSVITHQMHLELPKGTQASNVNVIQNPIDRQIRIEIPRADANYLYDYQMLGEIDSMESLDYSSEGGMGTILLTTKNIVEAEISSDSDYLYLDFLSPKETYDRIIVVDAGHGGNDPGAVSENIYEKNLTLAIVQQIKALFDEAADSHVGVFYTRMEDVNPELSSRVGLANNLDADLFVSVHINSYKAGANVQGVEVMYDELAQDTAFDTKDFAQICLDETEKATGAVKRRLVPGNKIHIIRNSNAPAALVEVGFITNPQELEKLADVSYQHRAAQGVYNALIKSLEMLDSAAGQPTG